jgi:hypothetical protein
VTYLERDFKKGVLFVDPATKSIYRLNVSGDKEFLSEEECTRRFRRHTKCGGWFLSMQDLNSFRVVMSCIKCGFQEKVSVNTGCSSCPD